MTRKELNHNIRALAHGILGLDEDTYRIIVENLTGKRHITQCDDEEANLVYLALKKMRDNQGTYRRRKTNPDQHRMIAKLGYILKWTWEDIAHFCLREVKKNSTRSCNASELSKVIRGMIGVIDYKLQHKLLEMNHTERFNYLQFTKHHRDMDSITTGSHKMRKCEPCTSIPSSDVSSAVQRDSGAESRPIQ
jgi:hypothetical protein